MVAAFAHYRGSWQLPYLFRDFARTRCRKRDGVTPDGGGEGSPKTFSFPRLRWWTWNSIGSCCSTTYQQDVYLHSDRMCTNGLQRFSIYLSSSVGGLMRKRSDRSIVCLTVLAQEATHERSRQQQ